jgi:hypothetical protein
MYRAGDNRAQQRIRVLREPEVRDKGKQQGPHGCVELLFHMFSFSAAAYESLRGVRQLRGEFRPSLFLVGELCGKAKLPFFLLVVVFKYFFECV